MIDQQSIDRLRHQPVPPAQLLIDGVGIESASGQRLSIVSPIDGQELTTIAAGTAADTEHAIAAARAAFEDGRWSRMAPAARKAVMHKWADLIQQNALELAVLGVRDNGTEIGMAFRAEPGSASATIRYYAETIDKLYGEIAPTPDNILGLIHKQPVGVVAAIIPWNFPMMIGAWKLGPALATGNSVVVKPPESASLSLLRMCQLGLEAGIPAGVLNVVTGKGSVVGETLALSNDVDVLVFTGSGGVGRRINENAAKSNLKRTYLELGGKSANVVFADCPDIAAAVQGSASGIFRNSGQVCVAGSRLLVERRIHDQFVEALAKTATQMNVGDPLDMTSDVGAVHSAEQLEMDLQAVQQARQDGADVVCGGSRLDLGNAGYYMSPAVVTAVAPEADLFQNEVFGPVLAVTAFDDEEEAIALANNSVYGLAGGLWTRDISRAHRVVGAMNTGVVHVNGYGSVDITCPLGGVKQSGNGHDKSLHALDKYLNLKTAWFQL